MKRDIEYQIDLLKKEEEKDGPLFTVWALNIDKANDEEFKYWYHLQLLKDEGLITQLGKSNHYRLTAKGHDALDLHRQGLIKRAIDEMGNVGLVALIEGAKALLKSSIGL